MLQQSQHQYQSGYPYRLQQIQQLTLHTLPAGQTRRLLEECRVKSRCSCSICPACVGRASFIQGKRLLQAASRVPEHRLKLATFTTKDVDLHTLREAAQAIMYSTRATLKSLGLTHYAARSETSVDALIGSYHPHVHAIVNTAPSGKGYIKADDWQDAWLSELPAWLQPFKGGTHVERVRDIEGACFYVTKSPFRDAFDGTIQRIVDGIVATKGLRRFATCGAFRYQS